MVIQITAPYYLHCRNSNLYHLAVKYSKIKIVLKKSPIYLKKYSYIGQSFLVFSNFVKGFLWHIAQGSVQFIDLIILTILMPKNNRENRTRL